MELIIVKSKDEMGSMAGKIFAEAISAKPDIVLGLATGSTPLPLYQELIRMCKNGTLDFSDVTSVNLDEYVGLSGAHDQSYRYFMNINLFDHINIDKAKTHVPRGDAGDPEDECARYDELIDNLGGIDLQLLGVGLNGHVGFNEPADAFSTQTHVVELAESTIQANSRFFENPSDVPRKAITMDIRHIMLAKKVILIAGPEKKELVEKAVYGDVTPQVPASVLQLHRNVTVILSES